MKKNYLIVLTIIVVIIMATRFGLAGIVSLMASAIKEFEGWNSSPPSVSYRNNNPGNIKDTGFEGTVGIDSEGHAIFDTYVNGWRALTLKIERAFLGQSQIYLPTMTLYQFFAIWAVGNSVPYAEFVASKLGVSPTTRLEELL